MAAPMALNTSDSVKPGLSLASMSPVDDSICGMITLTTYSHLWPDANDRTRKAVGELLDQSFGITADALRTEPGY